MTANDTGHAALVSLLRLQGSEAVQVHGATQDGRPVFRKRLSRAQFLGFLAKQSPAVVATMEACATAHGWGRAISEVRLIPPIYVSRLCVARRTTPLTPRQSPRRPQGQRCHDQ